MPPTVTCGVASVWCQLGWRPEREYVYFVYNTWAGTAGPAGPGGDGKAALDGEAGLGCARYDAGANTCND